MEEMMSKSCQRNKNCNDDTDDSHGHNGNKSNEKYFF